MKASITRKTRNTRNTTIPLLILTLAISASLQASDMYSPPEDDVEKAVSTTLFSKIDSNKDSQISLDEIVTYRAQADRKREEARANQIMANCDTNKDGQIGGDELKEFSMDKFDPALDGGPDDCRVPPQIIEMMDLDGNGLISKNEIMEGSMQHRRPPSKLRKKIEAKLKKKEDVRMKKIQQEQFKSCDLDKDQFLTLREAASMRCNIYTEMFDARDKDNDSLISLEEMLAHVEHPIFEPEHKPSRMNITPKLPPSVQLDRIMFTCDKNENGRLELDETAGKECEVDLNFFNSVDRDNDGAIDYKETKRLRMKQTFDRMDSNKDGLLDKNEFKGSRVRYM